jgi:DNA recombination protein RmuC
VGIDALRGLSPELLLAGAAAAIVVLLAAVAVQSRRNAARLADLQAARDSDRSLVVLQQEIDGLRDQVGRALGDSAESINKQLARMARALDQRLHQSAELAQQTQRVLGERLDNTAQVVGAVQRSLGGLEEANRRIYEIGRDISSLQEILRPPKLRGGLGELLLEDLLRQVLPEENLGFQHMFSSGQRVDAVIRLDAGLVPVDAKFPLENFRRVLDAADDDERARHRRAFVTDVRRHIDAIAERYIVPDEGTLEFALMYVPAENVYYEMIVKDGLTDGADIADYALRRRVIPVSPGTTYAYLQAIALGLRGLRIEQQARVIMERLSGVRDELERLREAYRLVGRHLGNATASAAAAERRLDRLDASLAALAGDEPVPAPAAGESEGEGTT